MTRSPDLSGIHRKKGLVAYVFDYTITDGRNRPASADIAFTVPEGTEISKAQLEDMRLQLRPLISSLTERDSLGREFLTVQQAAKIDRDQVASIINNILKDDTKTTTDDKVKKEVDDIDELNDSSEQGFFDPFDTTEPGVQDTPPSVDDIINNTDTTDDIVIDGDALNQDIEDLLNTKAIPDLILGSKKENIIKPQKGNFLMSGDNIGLYQTIDKDNVVKMTVLNLKNPEQLKEITLPSLAKEVTKQQVVEKLKKENTLYLKSVIKQEFGIELTEQDLKDSDLDLYIAENSLSSAQRKEIESLIKNNTIKIECAD